MSLKIWPWLLVAVATAGTMPALAQAPSPPPPPPASCRNTAQFDRWLAAFRQEAAKQGISQRTIQSALDGITLDESVIRRDRGQAFFAQSFLDFQAKLATGNRITSARNQIAKHRPLFDRAQKEFGVPPEVLTALWALESDFGSGMGNLPVLRSLATLAYDCRRSDMFRAELLDALRIIERGDLRPSDMIGSWAGELGQTQFLPSYYQRHAIDWDGDGQRDLFRSIPDIIGSSANFLSHLGWKANQPWLEEVRVPERLPWDQADLTIKLPRSRWAQWGVTRIDGRPLPNDATPASLLLLMGRNGPAFLAYENFGVFTEWNKSLNYATTAAYLATRVASAPPVSRGRGPVDPMEPGPLKELQQLLARQGYDVGTPDGRLGLATRAAVKSVQIRLGMPADSYPTLELLDRMRKPR
jgi:lytic murein transglycosylase